MEFDELFEECTNESPYNVAVPESYNFSHHLINEVESEYTGKNTDLIDRKKEILTLQKEIEHDKESIKRIKIPKGAGTPKTRERLAKQASDKRDFLRNKIKRAECRLDEIDVETNGRLTKEKEAAAKHMANVQKEGSDAVKEKFGWGNLNPYSDI